MTTYIVHIFCDISGCLRRVVYAEKTSAKDTRLLCGKHGRIIQRNIEARELER